MNGSIYPIKTITKDLVLDGDYYYTQSAMILGALASDGITLENFHTGIQTKFTRSLLRSIGASVEENDRRLLIKAPGDQSAIEEAELEYSGDAFTLALIVGRLAGSNKTCSLHYSGKVNPDIIDGIIEILNGQGIDLYNKAEDRLIVFRARRDNPVEVKIESSLAVQKNCLLMFGLSSGCAVTVREMITTANHFEQILARFCDSFRIEDTKILVTPDPRDPRKKMRVPEAEYKRQLFLPAGSAVNSGQLEAPVDLVSSLALLTLAAMRRHDYVLPGMAINRVSNKFLNYLKTSGIEVTVSDKAERGGDVIGTVAIKGKGLKAKKLSGEQSGILIDEMPFMATAAVLGNGTTIIRDIREFADLGVDPFEEIVDKLGILGVKCGLLEDGLVIEGIKEINGTDFGSFRNHKIALAFAVAAMCGQGHSTFDNLDLIQLHYPKLSTIFET